MVQRVPLDVTIGEEHVYTATRSIRVGMIATHRSETVVVVDVDCIVRDVLH